MSEQDVHLRGVTAALLTPRNPDGTIDEDGIRNQIDFIAGHCEAIAVLGAGVSEYQSLSSAEREERLVSTIALIKERQPALTIVAGVSATTEAETVKLAALAAEAGAEYLQLLIPQRPWGGEARGSELVEYFRRVLPQLPLPVVLYHHPGLGSDPALSTIEEICKLDGIVAFKDSSRNASRTLIAVQRLQHELGVSYMATIQPATLALLAGAAGVMTPPPFTLVAREIIDRAAAPESAALRELATITAAAPTGLCSEPGLLPGALEALRGLGVVANGHGAPYDSADGAYDRLDPSVRDWYEQRARGAADAG